MKKLFRRIVALAGVLFLAACAASPPHPAAHPQAAVLRLAEMAGTWNMRTLNEAGDSALVSYQMVATNERSGWTLSFPGRDPIEIRVLEVSGDEVVAEAGPYPSAVREGVMVSTHFAMRRHGERLVGDITAVYRMPEGEVTVPLRAEGTRAR